MSDKITVYEKPTCSKCREMTKLIKKGRFDFDKVNYYVEPFNESKLKALLKKMDISRSWH